MILSVLCARRDAMSALQIKNIQWTVAEKGNNRGTCFQHQRDNSFPSAFANGRVSPFSTSLPFLPELREIASGTLLGITNINRRFAIADVKGTIPAAAACVYPEIQFIDPIIQVSRGRWYIEFRIAIKNLKGNYVYYEGNYYEGNYEKKAMHLALASRETRIDRLF